MRRGRREAEQMVETRRAQYPAWRKLQFVRDFAENARGKVPVELLGGMQNFNERVMPIPLLLWTC